LYVFYYGFNYEKFFASYTTIYAFLLFGYLAWAVFSSIRRDIIKFLCISSLWMFAIANVLPIERFIFSANIALSRHTKSRINLFHLTNLSNDIYNQAALALEEGEFDDKRQWENWLRHKSLIGYSRKWYQSNLSLSLNCSTGTIDKLPVRNWKFQ